MQVRIIYPGLTDAATKEIVINKRILLVNPWVVDAVLLGVAARLERGVVLSPEADGRSADVPDPQVTADLVAKQKPGEREDRPGVPAGGDPG